MNNNQTFRVAPYSAVAWVWTIFYILIVIFFALRTVTAIAGGSFPDPIDVFFTLLVLAAVVYSWVRSVRSYSIQGKDLVIKRSGPGAINIALDEIEGALASPAIGAFFNMSILSTGGVFGWAGKARVRNPSDLKSLEANVFGTNAKYSVLLDLKSGRKVVLTPTDPAAMETALHIAGAGAQIRDTRPRLSTATNSSASSETADKPKPWLQGNKK